MKSAPTATIRRFAIDLPPAATARLERLKDDLGASSYGEVVRAALIEYEAALTAKGALSK